MKKNLLFSAACLLLYVVSIAQKTTQERLGYAKDAKLLILHADDLGVSHSEDSASLYALDKGYVSSASIMVPTPWFSEVAAYASKHPDADLGIHLTLTSEWNYYKWGPVASKDSVSSLLNNSGFFFDNTDSVSKKGRDEDVENELRSQIQRALKAGVQITHLDSHMGSVFIKKDFIKIYLKLAHEFHLPCLLNADAFKLVYHVDITDLITDKDVLTDHVYIASPPGEPESRATFYTNVLTHLQPGLSCLIVHTAYNDDEMQAVTANHPDYGAAWRQADYDFLSSDACKKLLASQNIHLITWKEIKEKLMP